MHKYLTSYSLAVSRPWFILNERTRAGWEKAIGRPVSPNSGVPIMPIISWGGGL